MEPRAHVGRQQAVTCDHGLLRHGRPLEDGAPANVVLYDPSVRRVVEAAESVSLSRNTPYAGVELPGRVVATFLHGKPTVLDGKLC
jgi:dihydroorotase